MVTGTGMEFKQLKKVKFFCYVYIKAPGMRLINGVENSKGRISTLLSVVWTNDSDVESILRMRVTLCSTDFLHAGIIFSAAIYLFCARTLRAEFARKIIRRHL